MGGLVLLVGILASLLCVLGTNHPWVVGDAELYWRSAQSLLPGSEIPLDDLQRNSLLRAPWHVLTLAAITGVLRPWLETDGILTAIRLFQGALLGGSVYLLYRILRLLDPSRVWPALLAVGLFLFYGPFFFLTSRLLVETQVVFFLLAFLFCWLRGNPVWAGVCLFLALSNSWFSYWPKLLVLLPGLFYLGKFSADKVLERQGWRVGLILLLGGVLGQGLSMLTPHQPLPPTAMWYYADNAGFSPLLNVHGLQSFMAVNGPQALHHYMMGHSASLGEIARWVFHDPQVFLLLLGTNVFRLFAHAENTYQQSWLWMSPELLQGYHGLLILGGLLALPVIWNRETKMRVVLLFLVTWLAYAMAHIEPRYNLPLMPFWILTLVYGLAVWISPDKHIGQFLTEVWKSVVAVCILLLIVYVPIYPVLLSFWQDFPLMLWQTIRLVLGFVLFWGLLRKIFKTLAIQAAGRKAFFGCGLLFLPVLAHIIYVPPETAWRVPVPERETAVIRKMIQPPNTFWGSSEALSPGIVTFLLLDATPPLSTAEEDLNITVNGLSVSSVSQPPAVLNQLKSLHGGIRPLTVIRQYRFLPLSKDVLDSIRTQGRADIRIVRNPAASERVALFGDYPLSGKNTDAQATYALPSPDWGRYSIYKAQYDGDGRAVGPFTASLADGSAWLVPDIETPMSGMKRDLSPEPGIQTGHYRIALFRLRAQDAEHPDMPAPFFYVEPGTGQFSQFFRLAY